MDSAPRLSALGDSGFQVLWEDGERTLCRIWSPVADGGRSTVLAAQSTAERPTLASLERLAHEYGLKDELECAWAARPLELVHEGSRTLLLLEDLGGEPLSWLLGAPMQTGQFLRLSIGIVSALGKAHQRGLVHKDLKPGHILVSTSGEVRLTGFGIASRLRRQRQAPEPPETIAGTLAYMAPEQTGRMNRSIDTRSDLYALGVTLYQMLTSSLPFVAADPMEWVHCHIARKPVAPSERLEGIPAVISEIVMKLLAKTAEDRYQIAAGVEHDLRRCLAEWDRHGRIDAFPLGQQDTPDQLLIPEKLYGREREIDTLLAAFDRIVKGCTPELVLVSGYSGIGKSAVVQELHGVLVPPRGLFAAGKFDQYKRDIPYSTLAQAFQSLVRSLLGKSDTELDAWRDALLAALGPNGRLMIDVVPDLKHIIDEQPPVTEMSPLDAQRRFQLVFRRFIGVFARPEHPLVLFLDDLQWLDAATLDLLEDLLTRSGLQHLMLIGAYRDNEVSATHPLRRKLEAIRIAGGKITEITIAPLARAHVEQFAADALRCESKRAVPLAELVHARTGGNPFFVIQFLYALTEEGLLIFDHAAARWSWDIGCIQATRYTDNVVELMVDKLSRLPAETQRALQVLACLGNAAGVATISIVFETSEEQVHAVLWPAIRQELVARVAGAYGFVHDRVQEAAYSLIPPERRSEMHLQLGRLLATHTPPQEREAAIFGIANQLNQGATLIGSQDEREQLAELNLLAGQRAKSSAAYASALTYLAAGAALLSEDAWARLHELSFALELQRAECELVMGALAESEARLVALSMRANTTVQRATVACLRVDLYVTMDQLDRAIAVALDFLRDVGIDWPSDPTEEQARCEYERIWSRLGSRTIEELRELPLMSDPDTLAIVELLNRVGSPAFSTKSLLFCLAACRAVNLSLEYGNSDASCVAYEYFAMAAGLYFGNYDASSRFARLGNQLAEKPELKRSQARTLELFGFISAWTWHVQIGRGLLLRAFELANRTGDLTFAAYACGQINANFLWAGDSLNEVQREAQSGLEFVQKLGFGLAVGWVTGQLGLIRTLRGLTTRFGSFDDETFDELEFERQLSSHSSWALVTCWYCTNKLQARYMAGDYAAALEAASRARPGAWPWMLVLETAEYHFYGALTHAACWDIETGASRQQHLEALSAHHRQLQVWAENCPENFENRAMLVGAEIARIEGRVLDAERLYEHAIRSARANSFIHNEALANELAAHFYATRDFETISHAYLRNARYGYLRWGADGKVRQLDQLHPHLRAEERAPGPTGTIGAPVEHLDLATVVSVSEAVSGEVVLEKLLNTLMRTAIQQAGAERGILLLLHEAEPRIAAEATTSGDTVVTRLRDAPLTGAELPEAVLHHVLRTRESVILDDAAARSPFATDRYIHQHGARSILCSPLLHRAKLIGVLYLENNLAPRVFAPARIAVLKLLASQAAIALENSRLYLELAEREARIRRLVDANIIGIFIWKLDGRVIEANEAFLRMVGHDRADLAAGRLTRRDLSPPEWRERDQQVVAELKTLGIAQPFEKEYFRKDGSRVPVLIGFAAFGGESDEGVAFVIDLTERRCAEAATRESERRYREVQTALAHANRLATVGEFTASIAHEIKQPIGAAATNAQAAIHWLRLQPPDLEEVRQALGRTVKDVMRASEVIVRMRDLVNKVPSRHDPLEVNEAILDVIALTRGEVEKHGVSARSQFAADLPLVHGDRVQLQQVMLNLIVNAVEAMSGLDDGPRELLISTAKDDAGDVLIAVRDSGLGLNPESVERIFEPFYTTKPDGMGMGLSICRSIIEAHGGRLWARTNEPRGAAFYMVLPHRQVVS